MNNLQPFEQTFADKNLVEASAGTGKTYNIVWLYLRFLLKENLSVDEILVVTFTKAATKELKERLLNSLQQAVKVLKDGYEGPDAMLKALNSTEWIDRGKAIEKLQEAMRSFDHAAVYTIHSFCKNVLEEMAFETGTSFDAELLGDDSEIIQEVIDDYWRNLVEQAEKDESKAILLQCLIDQRCTPDSLPDLIQAYLGKPYIRIFPEYIEWNRIEQDFDRLLTLYKKMRQNWGNERDNIINLLDLKIMSGYTAKRMPGRIQIIDDLCTHETPPIINPEKLKVKYFCQSYINEHLTSAAIKKGTPPPVHEFFQRLEEYSKLCEDLLLTRSVFLKQLLGHLQDELPAKKQQMEVLAYDDLLLNVHQTVTDPKRGKEVIKLLRSKYPVALVDEFQDTDPIQYEIFRNVYADSSAKLFMIGDSKQAIYSFRGADIFAYLQAREDTKNEHRFNLEHNFRSVPELLDGVNTFFGQSDHPFVLPEITFTPVQHGHKKSDYKRLEINNETPVPLQFIRFKGGDGESGSKALKETIAKAAAADIHKLICDGKTGRASIGSKAVTSGDIAVLVRTHNEGHLMSEALAKLGIKSVQFSKESVFNSFEAVEMELILTAIAEAGNERLIRAALTTSLMAKTANDLYHFDENEVLWERQTEKFLAWNHDWQEHGFAYMLQSLLKEGGVAENMMNHHDGERRLTNILHIGELLQQYEHDEKNGMRSLIKYLARKGREKKNGREEEELRLESDEGLVKIVTIHRSKGLEYPVVFCPFLWKGLQVQNSKKPFLFHSKKEKEACLDLTPKNGSERTKRLLKYYREELAEQMRLAYVAITRAKQYCAIYWHPQAKEIKFSPLGYILLGRDTVIRQMRKKLKLAKITEDINEETLNAVIRDFKVKAEGVIQFKEWQEPAALPSNGVGAGQGKELKAKTFSRSNPLISRQISSFSSLMRDDHDEFDSRDYDQYEVIKADTASTRPTSSNIYHFPRGPQPGTCVHNIFEQLDFSDLSNLDDVISYSLESYDIDLEWVGPLKKNISTIVGRPLINGEADSRLSSLKPEDFVHEMEFYFDMEAVSQKQIMRLIGNSKYNSNMALAGFMKGYIDLIVRFGQRFYIIDYKTNFLGDRPEDYSRESLAKEIKEKGYDLQYHLYTTALHRHLKKRMNTYNFEDHFGGILYLFIRGISDGRGDFNGIYFDRPTLQSVNILDEYLKTGQV